MAFITTSGSIRRFFLAPSIISTRNYKHAKKIEEITLEEEISNLLNLQMPYNILGMAKYQRKLA
jgi:hypothetical protein